MLGGSAGVQSFDHLRILTADSKRAIILMQRLTECIFVRRICVHDAVIVNKTYVNKSQVNNSYAKAYRALETK